MFPVLIPTMIATPMMVFNARALAYPVTVVCASSPFSLLHVVCEGEKRTGKRFVMSCS